MTESLLSQNAWMKDARTRAEALRVAVVSSSAVEGIVKPFAATAKAVKPAGGRSAKSVATRD